MSTTINNARINSAIVRLRAHGFDAEAEVMIEQGARMAELEAEREGLAQIVNARVASPPPGTVAALLLKVEEEAKRAHEAEIAEFVSGTSEWSESDKVLYLDGIAHGLRYGAELATATLGAPTPLDRAVREVCALLPREYPDGATEATRTASSKAALAALDVEEGDIIGARAQMVDAMADLLGALLACDAPATKEPG